MELLKAKDELKSYKQNEAQLKQYKEYIKGNPEIGYAEAEEMIRQLQSKNHKIFIKVMSLKQPYQRILFYHYICGNTVDETAYKIGYCRTQTYKLKNKGVEEYARY